MGWVLTKGLQNLRAQVDEAFPDRDKTSDGTIGDAAHQAETSGHNPDDTAGSKAEWNGDPDSTPEVRAWDMDSDLRMPGVTAQQVVDHIRALPGVASVLRYMIYNRRIYKAANGWAAETYTGPSAHTEHIHFSGAYSQAADSNTTFDYRLEDLMAIGDDVTKIRDLVEYDQKVLSNIQLALQSIAAKVNADPVDEQAIVAGVLAGLSPAAIAAAIPADLARQVADELASRLAA